MIIFVLSFSKPDQLESPKWFTQASDKAVRLRRSAFRLWYSSLPPQSGAHLLYRRQKKTSSSAILKIYPHPSPRARHFVPLLKQCAQNFCPLNFSPICISSGDLVCKADEKAENFTSGLTSNSNFIRYFTPISSLAIIFSFLLLISTGKIRQSLQYLNVHKPPGQECIPANRP